MKELPKEIKKTINKYSAYIVERVWPMKMRQNHSVYNIVIEVSARKKTPEEKKAISDLITAEAKLNLPDDLKNSIKSLYGSISFIYDSTGFKDDRIDKILLNAENTLKKYEIIHKSSE